MEVASKQTLSSTEILLNCSTLISYLRTLDREVLSELYSHPATCLAVFRYAIRLLARLQDLLSNRSTEVYTSARTNFATSDQWKLNLNYRELPQLAKQFVMRLLYVEQAVPKAVVSSWVNSHTGGASLTQANEALTELRVWQETAMPGGLPAWILKNTFRKNLKIVLTGG